MCVCVCVLYAIFNNYERHCVNNIMSVTECYTKRP